MGFTDKKKMEVRNLVTKTLETKNLLFLGVLSQELDEAILSKLPKKHNYTSYIAASYVKYIHMLQYN